MTINEHTGAKQQTKPTSKEYEEGWERIFGKRPYKLVENCLSCKEDSTVRFMSKGTNKGD